MFSVSKIIGPLEIDDSSRWTQITFNFLDKLLLCDTSHNQEVLKQKSCPCKIMVFHNQSCKKHRSFKIITDIKSNKKKNGSSSIQECKTKKYKDFCEAI